MAKWNENNFRVEETHTQIINSVVNLPTVGVDARLCVSFMARDLRYEFENNEHLSTSEMREWWLSRTDKEIEQIGHYILAGDDIWRTVFQELAHGMEFVRKEIEANSDDLYWEGS
jgi:hypothetical protein